MILLNKKPAEVVVPGRWTDVLNGGASVSGNLTLATAEVRVLVQ